MNCQYPPADNHQCEPPAICLNPLFSVEKLLTIKKKHPFDSIVKQPTKDLRNNAAMKRIDLQKTICRVV
jgi:hypothetical protein